MFICERRFEDTHLRALARKCGSLPKLKLGLTISAVNYRSSTCIQNDNQILNFAFVFNIKIRPEGFSLNEFKQLMI